MNDEHREAATWTTGTARAMNGRSGAITEFSMSSSATVMVFVYGTLLQGEPNHDFLASARLIRAARTEPSFELVSLGPFPAMVPGGKAAVVGEIYEVDDETLAALDRLEGHPDFYHREWIRLEDGDDVLAYVMEPERVCDRPRIPGGDWRQRAMKEDSPCEYGF
jgi:gamma-glutamylcyclotransferase (GGCT)/AIG2-like uncharacterized protein YtfP